VDQGILPGSLLTADISKFTEKVKLVDRIFSPFNFCVNLHLSYFTYFPLVVLFLVQERQKDWFFVVVLQRTA
jgi:hypothetical protein